MFTDDSNNSKYKMNYLFNELTNLILTVDELEEKVSNYQKKSNKCCQLQEKTLANDMQKMKNMLEEIKIMLVSKEIAKCATETTKNLNIEAIQVFKIQQSIADLDTMFLKMQKQLLTIGEISYTRMITMFEEVHIQEIQQAMQKNLDLLEIHTKKACKATKNIKSSFANKCIFLLTIIFMTSITTSFLINNNNSPWYFYNKSNIEKKAGHLLLNVWPKLSIAEKNDIMQKSNT